MNEENLMTALSTCMGAVVVDKDAAGMTNLQPCGKKADPLQMRIVGYDGWAVMVPLCQAHQILWNTDVEEDDEDE